MDEMKASNNVILIGDFLKSKREDMRFSLDKISQKTKISINILRALEINDFASLPSPAYVKGFVLSYARIIGVDQSEVINKLEYTYLTITGKPFPALNHTKLMSSQSSSQGTVNQTKITTETPEPSKILETDRVARERRRVVIPSLVFTGLAVAFFGLYQLVTHTIDKETEKVQAHREGPTFVPSSELVEISKTSEDEKVEKTVEPEVVEEKKEIKPEPEKVEVVEAKPAPKPVEPPAVKPLKEVRRNFPERDFRKITVKLFAVIPDAEENQDETLLPPDIKSKMDKSLENVYIRAVDGNTWLSYKIDNSPIQSAILEKGKGLFMQGKELTMFLGNVKITKVFYQNRLIDPPTQTGFKSLIFPESNNSKHVLPLFPKAADDVLYTSEEYQRRMKLEEKELGDGTTVNQ